MASPNSLRLDLSRCLPQNASAWGQRPFSSRSPRLKSPEPNSSRSSVQSPQAFSEIPSNLYTDATIVSPGRFSIKTIDPLLRRLRELFQQQLSDYRITDLVIEVMRQVEEYASYKGPAKKKRALEILEPCFQQFYNNNKQTVGALLKISSVFMDEIIACDKKQKEFCVARHKPTSYFLSRDRWQTSLHFIHVALSIELDKILFYVMLNKLPPEDKQFLKKLQKNLLTISDTALDCTEEQIKEYHEKFLRYYKDLRELYGDAYDPVIQQKLYEYHKNLESSCEEADIRLHLRSYYENLKKQDAILKRYYKALQQENSFLPSSPPPNLRFLCLDLPSSHIQKQLQLYLQEQIVFQQYYEEIRKEQGDEENIKVIQELRSYYEDIKEFYPMLSVGLMQNYLKEYYQKIKKQQSLSSSSSEKKATSSSLDPTMYFTIRKNYDDDEHPLIIQELEEYYDEMKNFYKNPETAFLQERLQCFYEEIREIYLDLPHSTMQQNIKTYYDQLRDTNQEPQKQIEQALRRRYVLLCKYHKDSEIIEKDLRAYYLRDKPQELPSKEETYVIDDFLRRLFHINQELLSWFLELDLSKNIFPIEEMLLDSTCLIMQRYIPCLSSPLPNILNSLCEMFSTTQRPQVYQRHLLQLLSYWAEIPSLQESLSFSSLLEALQIAEMIALASDQDYVAKIYKVTTSSLAYHTGLPAATSDTHFFSLTPIDFAKVSQYFQEYLQTDNPEDSQRYFPLLKIPHVIKDPTIAPQHQYLSRIFQKTVNTVSLHVIAKNIDPQYYQKLQSFTSVFSPKFKYFFQTQLSEAPLPRLVRIIVEQFETSIYIAPKSLRKLEKKVLIDLVSKSTIPNQRFLSEKQIEDFIISIHKALSGGYTFLSDIGRSYRTKKSLKPKAKITSSKSAR